MPDYNLLDVHVFDYTLIIKKLADTIEKIIDEAHVGVTIGIEIKKADKIIFERKVYNAFPAASLAKIPICLYVFENNIDLEKDITLSKKDITTGTGWLQYLQPGLKIKIKDLVYLILAESDNTAAKCLVRFLGGPQKINQFLKEKVNKTRLEVHRDGTFGYGITTAEEVVYLFEKLAEHPLAKDYLQRNRFDWGLRNHIDSAKLNFITYLKDWIFVKTQPAKLTKFKTYLLSNKRIKASYANKDGSWQTNRHEVALINGYTISVLTSGYDKELAYDKNHPAFKIFRKIGIVLNQN